MTGGNCFVAGTKIATTKGLIPIEDISLADEVISACEITGELSVNKVTHLHRGESFDIWEIHYDHDNDPATLQESLTATGNHPIWSPQKQVFQRASSFREGQTLRSLSHHEVPITSVRRIASKTPQKVYNFTVENDHTYFAGKGGVWVHNDNCKELREEVIAMLVSRLVDEDAASGSTSFDPNAYNRIQTEVMDQFFADDKYTAGQRTMTGVTIFESNPKIIDGEREDDADVIDRFVEETRLGEYHPSKWKRTDSDGDDYLVTAPLPVSVARTGDGEQPYFGTPNPWSPKCWRDKSKELIATANDRLGTYDQNQIDKFKESATHAEAKSLIGLIEEEGHCDVVYITTGRQAQVCKNCVNIEGSGLAVTLHSLRSFDPDGKIQLMKIWGTRTQPDFPQSKGFADRRLLNFIDQHDAWEFQWDASAGKVIEPLKQ